MATPEVSRSGEPRAVLTLLVDAHVHIYSCFEPGVFFSRAWANFCTHGDPGSSAFVLLLTESWGADWFARLTRATQTPEVYSGPSGEAWRVSGTNDPVALRVAAGEKAMFVVAGSQIVTSEDLEVLALGLQVRIPDGRPLATVVERVREGGALAVLPWGFGKWWGRRGRIVRDYLEGQRDVGLFLGDNGGRPMLAPTPSLFALGRASGLRILPGSDPLPMPSGVRSPGGYGFRCRAPFDSARPWTSVRAALADKSMIPEPYGRREWPHRFIHAQVRMQLMKRRRRAQARLA